MKLVIAEKPSVAGAIANVLNAKDRKEGYIEGNGYIVSWCVGHLVGLANAEKYDSKYEKWTLTDLPIIPNEYKYEVSKGKEKQLKILCDLLNNKEITEVINACDSGREGELIFRLVYNYSKTNIPIKRLWISSMEDKSIKDGFNSLKDGKEYDNLYMSAMCRQKADWLVGINATRLFSSLYNQSLNVGRVISPTLGMAVVRNANIQAFKSKPFYTIKLSNNSITLSSEKIEEKQEAEELVQDISTRSLIVTNVEKSEKTENPPKLYDLTSLQRECNRKLGLTSSETLDCVQKLYENKICTYPRTDSKFITDDMEDSVADILDITKDVFGIKSDIANNSKQVVNNKKVTDHHAIIPTISLKDFDLTQLSKDEKDVLEMIAFRLISAVGDKFKYDETIISAKYEDIDNIFTCKGKTIIDDGFKKYSKKDIEEDENEAEATKELPELKIGDEITDISSTLDEGKTKPPKQYTEDTILSAMENASKEEKFVDKEFVGIGTPATRSSIIEKLITTKLIERKGDKKTKYLIPTDKGIALITVLPESIQSPLMTAMWEEKLKDIELGNLSSDEFMNEIKDMVEKLTKTYEKVAESENIFPSKFKPIGECPRCKKNVVDNPKTYSCVDRDCGFALWKENKLFTNIRKELSQKFVIELLNKGKAPLKGCYSQKTGKTFDCIIYLEDTGKYINFKMDFPNKK